jgi:hypothetical protein
VFYTATRLLPATTGLALWAWLRDGTMTDPANILLLFSLAAAVVGLAWVRRYWHIRNTSRSRRDSSLWT